MFRKKKKSNNAKRLLEAVTLGDTATFSQDKLDQQGRLIVEVFGTTKEYVV